MRRDHRAQRPHSVVTTSWSRPIVRHHVGDLPRTPCGAGEHLLYPMLPPSGRHPGPGPAPCQPAGTKAAPQPERRPSGGLGYGRPSCEPATANAAPSLPVRPDAGRRPRRPPTMGARRPLRPAGAARQRATPGSSTARTGRRQRRGHQSLSVRTPGCTGHRTPGPWTSARPVGRTSPRRTGRGGQGNDRPGRRPDSSRPTTPAGRPTSPGSRRLGALGHPRRLRGDGTYATALTAAATGQLPSTARHQAAPPAHCSPQKKWVESKAPWWLPSGT
jgi:hypothetical protein